MQPNSNCCQLDEGEIVGCELVVAGGDPTTLFDFVKEPHPDFDGCLPPAKAEVRFVLLPANIGFRFWNFV